MCNEATEWTDCLPSVHLRGHAKVDAKAAPAGRDPHRSVTTTSRVGDVVHATRPSFDPGSPKPSSCSCGSAVRRGGTLEPGALALIQKLQAKAKRISSLAFCGRMQRNLSLSGGASFMSEVCQSEHHLSILESSLPSETTKATRRSPSLQAALRLCSQRMRHPARAGARPVRFRLQRAACRHASTEATVAVSGLKEWMSKSFLISIPRSSGREDTRTDRSAQVLSGKYGGVRRLR